MKGGMGFDERPSLSTYPCLDLLAHITLIVFDTLSQGKFQPSVDTGDVICIFTMLETGLDFS